MGTRSRYWPAYPATLLPCAEPAWTTATYQTASLQNKRSASVVRFDRWNSRSETHTTRIRRFSRTTERRAGSTARTSQHSIDAVGSRSFHQKWYYGQDSGNIPMNFIVLKYSGDLTVNYLVPKDSGNLTVNNIV